MTKMTNNEANDIWIQCRAVRDEQTDCLANLQLLVMALDKESDSQKDRKRKREQAWEDRRVERDSVRPNYETDIARLHGKLRLAAELREAMGDYADLFQSRMSAFINRSKEDAAR
jgi:hypothetical protein